MNIGFPADWSLAARRALAMLAVVGLLLGASLRAVAAEPADADAVAKWTKALSSRDEKQRVEAIDALGQMGPAAKAATTALAEQLSDKSPVVRSHAAYALMSIGPDAIAAAPALAKAIADPDANTQRMAVAALERIHPDPVVVVEGLGKALEDEDPEVRVAALSALTEYSDAAVPVLIKALANAKTAYWAALALGELGDKAKSAVEPLAATLKDNADPQVRREVLIALARIGPDAAAAVPAITPLLANTDPGVEYAAAFALGSMGPAAASAAQALRDEMASKDEMEHCVSCWALARIEPGNKEMREHAIAELTEAIKDENPRVQSAVLRGLMDLQPSPEQLVPVLAYVIGSGKEPAVHEALGALAGVGEAAAPVLSEALKHPEARGRAALLIQYLGPKAKSTVPALAAALDDKDPEVRREILFALAEMKQDAAPATDALIQALGDSEPNTAAVAAYALGQVGPDAKAALAKLQEELTSPDPLLRVACAYALVHVAPGNEALARTVLPVLVQGLKNPLAAARRGAAEALGEVGKPALNLAEGPLREATKDDDPSVREAAEEALVRIGAAAPSKPQ